MKDKHTCYIVLDYIKDHYKHKGYSPTVREIAKYLVRKDFGYSTSFVFWLLNILEEKKLIRRGERYQHRTISVTEKGMAHE